MERHELDAFSLVAGLAFTGLGVLFLLDGSGSLAVQPRWVWPVLLIALGVAGLLASRPRRDETDR
jgi:hypothetical protein